MELMRHFWDAAELDPRAAEMDEGVRFPLCHPDVLKSLVSGAGLGAVGVRVEVRETVGITVDIA